MLLTLQNVLQVAFVREDRDPFDEVLPLCKRTSGLIQEVFSNPETVMGKLLQNVYSTKLHVSILS